jgi:ABC-type transport system substrate-binding protein
MIVPGNKDTVIPGYDPAALKELYDKAAYDVVGTSQSDFLNQVTKNLKTMAEEEASALQKGDILADTEELPIAASLIFSDRMSALYKNAQRVMPIEGFKDIVIHGDGVGFGIVDSAGNERTVSVLELADWINDSNYKGHDIRLLSCSSGLYQWRRSTTCRQTRRKSDCSYK